jgi:hypothetical protein
MQQLHRVAWSLSGTIDSNAGAAAAFDAGAVDASKSFDILVLNLFSEVRPAQCVCTPLKRAFHLRQVLHVLVASAASHGVEFSDAILRVTISLSQAWDRFLYVYFDLIRCVRDFSLEEEAAPGVGVANQCVHWQ